MKTQRLVVLGILTCFVGAVDRATAQSSDVVRVTLLSSAAIDDTIITLEQIATVDGGPSHLRQRIAKIDVADVKTGNQAQSVSADQVRFRLILAGFDESRFRIDGARRVDIRETGDAVSQRRILSEADAAVRRRYAGDGSRLQLTPARGVVAPLLILQRGDDVRLDAAIATGAPTIGEMARVHVSISVNGKVREVVPVLFEVAATEAPPRLEARAIRPVSGTTPVPVVGIAIKNHDAVTMVTQIGGVRIEAQGEALQDGRTGELIRVRNNSSSRIVSGRVEGPGFVRVD